MNWQKLTNDPLDINVKVRIKAFLRSSQAIFDGDLGKYFAMKSENFDVLHVGCFEHDLKYARSAQWKHKAINDAAKACVGLDINQSGIEAMRAQGYDAVCADATSDIQLDRRFDLIIVGDVIEHLTNIGGLMDFCRRHLLPGGKVILSTPNPFFIGSVLPAWSSGPMIANFEHTCWISESNMLEICRRTDMEITAIIYPLGKSSKNLFISQMKRLAFGFRSFALFTTVSYELRPAS